MLNKYDVEKEFKPFPVYENRNAWNELPQEIKNYYISDGENLLNKNWESLNAVRYMDFVKNGNRTLYQDVYYKRRRNVFTLAMAECMEGKGRFIEDLINGIWLLCEETTWVVPAHNRYQTSLKEAELCDIEEPPYIDLFSAETASTLSWVYYFLSNEIEKISPIVKRRIELEIDRRILKPYVEYSYYDWMGLCHSKPINNWNVWINSNVLISFLIFAKDKERSNGISKVIDSTNRFLGFYEEDGGCDEGPSYFGVAGASFLDILEELECVNSNVKEMYEVPLVKNMAAYIYKVYIGNRFYVNFADAHPNLSVAAMLLGRIGEKIKDNNMVGFASYLIENNFVEPQHHNLNNWNLFRHLSNLFHEKPKGDFVPPKTSWFDGIQVITARDNEDLNGYFIAAKGGHNFESHNHNDIGNFVLYYQKKPIVIDVGVGVYTKKTFSKDRYDIWSMQSSYHNIPKINGYDQVDGREFCASNVECVENSHSTTLTLDINKAYPSEANINNYKREIYFDHSVLRVKDTYDLEVCKEPIVLNLMCYEKPVVGKNSIVLGRVVDLNVDMEIFKVEIDEIQLNDELMIDDWGKNILYRLRLISKECTLKGELTMEFKRSVE
ncbi:MAG: heparinase II/III family protein [Lachnospirales bacterium]